MPTTLHRSSLLLGGRTVALAALLCWTWTFGNELPPLEFDPPVTVDMLLTDLAVASRVASAWLLEVDEGALDVWVWRLPCTYNVHVVFEDNDWVGAATVGRSRRDLGVLMRSNAEFYGPYFDLVLDPTWSTRALVFAEVLVGVDQRFAAYSLVDDATGGAVSVEVTSHYIDLVALELLDGPFVQVTRHLDE